MIKKTFILCICLMMVLMLFACGSANTQSGSKQTEATKAPQVAETPVPVEEPTDAPTPTPEPTPTREPTPTPEQFKPLEVKEFGYSVSHGYLYYSICLHNPNESFFVEFPTFRVTARDANNVLLGTEEQVLFSIYPQQDVWHAFLGFEVEEAPATVDVEVLMPKDYNITKVSKIDQPTYIPLAAINYAKRGNKIVGEVQNDNDYDIKQAIVTIVYRDADGKLLGGDSTFIDSVPAHGTAPFEESVYTPFSDIFEVYAGRWD